MKRIVATLFALLLATAAHAQSGLLPANQVWAGPPSGGQGFARARALVAADLPALSFGSFSLASGQIAVGQVSGFAGAVAMSGDCTIVASGAITCAKTGGVAFAASATTNALNATNISSGTLPAARLPSTPLSNSIAAGVSLNNTTTYFDGPNVAQGVAGTWYASGSVSLTSTTAGDNIVCKLWDGTTVADVSNVNITSAGFTSDIALSGVIASPAGNIRISCKDATSVNGAMNANADSITKASSINAFRIN